MIKIGVIGLAESEWMETVIAIDFHDVIFESFIEVGTELANELRTIDVIFISLILTKSFHFLK